MGATRYIKHTKSYQQYRNHAHVENQK
ncbi:hypothetical protein PHET_05810 [Paragonimus heterotremus]|uniref:Uncharacterized protein n=1 Tax=Paragonimus heterotremus TaxID=100268 RepID=A0A8J4T7S2_9TREM|nr:hypothetical protein PHET_05810 [Paragonimus heterotremus]